MNKIDEILDELDEVLDRAKPVPFGGHRYVADVERLRELTNDARLHLPQEIKQARLIAFDEKRILNEAKAKAEDIISQAEKRAAAIVSQDSIIKEAKKKAYDILAKAQANAKDVKSAADAYVEKIINNTEKYLTISLQELKKTKSGIAENRRRK